MTTTIPEQRGDDPATAVDEASAKAAEAEAEAARLEAAGAPAEEIKEAKALARAFAADLKGAKAKARQATKVAKEEAARRKAAFRPAPGASGRLVIDVTDEPNGVTEVTHALHSGAITDVYLRGRRPVWIGQADDGPYIEEVTKDALTLALHEHAEVIKHQKEGPVPVLLPVRVASVVLARNDWKLPVLKGVTSVPLIGPDGELHLTEGYNPLTGWFYNPRVQIKPVPEDPTPEQIAEARQLIVGKMLGDFPWVAPSDLAQFVATLFVPLLRAMVHDPTPLWVITATNPGSGKSLLSRILGDLFGVHYASWGQDNAEQRKIITSVLMGSGAPVTVFDNVPSGHTLRYPVMSELITSSVWGDRVLGKSEMTAVPNTTLWVANGNSLTVGDDLARRSLWVRLDPDIRPDTRDPSDFAVGDLNEWLQLHASDVLHALLTILRGWVSAGMPKTDDHIASFGAWPRTLGGILAWLEVPGWLADREAQMEEADEDAMEWGAFLAKWHEVFGSSEVKTNHVIDAVYEKDGDGFGFGANGPLADVIPREPRGSVPSVKQLGMWIKSREGRHFGAYRLRKRYDSHRKVNLWRVEQAGEDTGRTAG